MEPTHNDLLVVLAFLGAISLAGFSFLGWIAWRIHVDVKRGERTSRMVAALVVQESEKIRALLAD
ncbi:MAG: hypothetical protein FJZ38_08445 [Candidatus Rokubacteria bacterium]|nr:hypothetical protein [Candidatus Rokubacteria bacterium]